jgi:hypothetical protein
VSVSTTTDPALVDVETSLLEGNGSGIFASGANARARVAGTRITGNTSGLIKTSSGVIESFQNNKIAGNTVDGTFSGTLAPQ